MNICVSVDFLWVRVAHNILTPSLSTLHSKTFNISVFVSNYFQAVACLIVLELVRFKHALHECVRMLEFSSVRCQTLFSVGALC